MFRRRNPAERVSSSEFHQRQLVGVTNDGHHQPIFEGDRRTEVDISVEDYSLPGIAGIDRRKLLESACTCQQDKIID